MSGFIACGATRSAAGGTRCSISYTLTATSSPASTERGTTPRLALYIEKILKPLSEARGGIAIWMDNCAVHKVPEIQARLESANVTPLWLPPNMTAILKVIDLIVNGPIKAKIRKVSAYCLVGDFLS